MGIRMVTIAPSHSLFPEEALERVLAQFLTEKVSNSRQIQQVIREFNERVH